MICRKSRKAVKTSPTRIILIFSCFFIDFQKAILTFGVERTPDGMGFIWDRFKAIAELRKKSDEALESYLAKLIELSKKTIEYHIKIARMPDGDAHGEPYPVGDDQETVTIDRAKKVIRRIEFFDVLRLQVLHLPDVSFYYPFVSFNLKILPVIAGQTSSSSCYSRKGQYA